MQPHVLLSLAAFALAGCNPPAAAPEAAAPGYEVATPADFKLPQGGGCAGDIARYRAILDNDLAMGAVARSVYNQIGGEIAEAERACSLHHDAEARAMILASRRRHGYRASL